MGLFRNILGIALVMLAWFNILDISLPVRILMFIVGFDLMSIVLKIGVFVLGFFGFLPGVANLGFTLMILMVVEIIISLFALGILLRTILKPIGVFAVAFMAGLGFNSAIVISLIDLILNLDFKK